MHNDDIKFEARKGFGAGDAWEPLACEFLHADTIRALTGDRCIPVDRVIGSFVRGKVAPKLPRRGTPAVWVRIAVGA